MSEKGLTFAEKNLDIGELSVEKSLERMKDKMNSIACAGLSPETCQGLDYASLKKEIEELRFEINEAREEIRLKKLEIEIWQKKAKELEDERA